MDDQPPPPSRRDPGSPAAGHHGHDTRLRDAYLAELWPTCRELSYGERAAKLADDRRRQRQLEDAQAELDAATSRLRAAS